MKRAKKPAKKVAKKAAKKVAKKPAKKAAKKFGKRAWLNVPSGSGSGTSSTGPRNNPTILGDDV